MIAVIGGSGFEKFEDFKTIELLNIETPFGKASTGFKKVSVDGTEFLFISRHGDHHEFLPSEINYRANIYALKSFGATSIISFSAVGSLQKELAPGDLVIPYQYIDRTKGLRKSTFLGEGLIGHVSLAKPICEMMAENFKSISKQFDFNIHFSKTYICIEGPYFSTLAESNSYRQMNCDIIGMSNFPEYALAREAGLPYLPCCFVTDYDCWDTTRPHVTVEEVIKVMRGNNQKAFSVLKTFLQKNNSSSNAAGNLSAGSYAFEGGLRTGLFMASDMIPESKREIMQVLVK